MNYRYHHLHMVCSNLDATIEFFCETLEAATLVARKQFAGAEGATLDMSGSNVNLRAAKEGEVITADSAEPRFGYDHLCLEVEDVDAAYEALQARGVEFTKAPTMLADLGLKVAFLRGPDQIAVEILQPLS